jgi:hypothetical protein
MSKQVKIYQLSRMKYSAKQLYRNAKLDARIKLVLSVYAHPSRNKVTMSKLSSTYKNKTNMCNWFWYCSVFQYMAAIQNVPYAEVKNFWTVQDLRFSQQWLWRMPSPGMWHCVDHITSICRVEKYVRGSQDLHSTTSQKMAFFNFWTVQQIVNCCCIKIAAYEM